MAVAAPAAGSPNGVGGKRRPKEALLPTYGIGLVAKGYNEQPVSPPKTQTILNIFARKKIT